MGLLKRNKMQAFKNQQVILICQQFRPFTVGSHMYITSSSKFMLILLSLMVISSADVCGNNALEGVEECDDGNLIPGDGCDDLCVMQPFYQCIFGIPNGCRINVVVTLSKLGVQRITKSNTAVFYFLVNYQFSALEKIDFRPLFSTSIGVMPTSVEYSSSTSIIKVTIDYLKTLQNTFQNFQLLLSATDYFWYDSNTVSFEIHGANCELTYQDSLWLQSLFKYIFLTLIIISILVGFLSLLYEKWIGLQLIQTYQSVYYMMLLLREYPYEFTPLTEMLRYSNGYDDIVPQDYERTYTMSSHIIGLGIQKEFAANFNVSLGLIVAAMIVLAVLAIMKLRVKVRLQSQINSQYKRKLHKLSKYFDFAFGEVFVLIVLSSMFKIINSFTIQLSKQDEKLDIFEDQLNVFVALFSFLILFGVIIYIFNWYVLIPDTITEHEVHLSLRFRNMKFYYPLMYLTYQIIFICTLSIFYRRQFISYIMIVLQLAYFVMIVLVWPYNTPRKINRMLHNFTLLFNQFIVIFILALNFRWKEVEPGNIETEFLAYLFFIVAFLVISTILTILRLLIFDKDVQLCVKKQEQTNDVRQEQKKIDGHATEQSPTKLIKEEGAVHRPKRIPSQSQDFSQLSHSKSRTMSRFHNEQFSRWMKDNHEILKNRHNIRVKSIKKTTQQKLAELIKTPLQMMLEKRQNEMQNDRQYQQ